MATVKSAVIRVKRRCDDEPLDALVLACKRRKKENDLTTEDDNPFTSILKFAGTVRNQDENVAAHISTFKKDVKTLTHVPNLSGKLRKETKKVSQENRYKVVSNFRSLDETDELNPKVCNLSEEKAGSVDLKNVVILDIEDTNARITSDDKEGASESYVYDLYYTGDSAENWDDALLDQMVSVQPLPSELVYGQADSDSDRPDDDVDSNDENNSRNEYPDTDESMDDEERLVMEMGGFRIDGGDSDLSSDEQDEGYLRCEDGEPLDIARYGQDYARYKARITKELYCNEVQSNSDDESD